MNDKVLLKSNFYDRFKCIAGDCKFTCCAGWRITIDKQEFENYQNKGMDICTKEDENHFCMKMDDKDKCVCLNKDGLCQLVVDGGDEAIGYTCQSFPRHSAMNGDIQELYLSNACPAVIKLFMQETNPMVFMLEDKQVPIRHGLVNWKYVDSRDLAIDIIQLRDFPYWTRLYMLYMWAREAQLAINEGMYEAVENKFLQGRMLVDMQDSLMKAQIDDRLIIQSHYELFEKLIFEKSKDYGTRTYLLPIAKQIPLWEIDDLIPLKYEFDDVFSQYDTLMEHVCVNVLFVHSCEEEDEDYFENRVIAIVLEMAVIKITCFYTWLLHDKQLTDDNVCEIITYWARSMEHNNAIYQYVVKLKELGEINKGKLLLYIR